MTFLLNSTGYVLRVSPCVLIFNTQQSSPCLLLLVRLSVSFSCSRLIQIKLSFMFLSHSPSVVTQTHTHTNTTNIQHACIRLSIVFQLSTSTAFLFAKWLSYHMRVCELCLHVRLSYLQWGERAKATKSICSNVRNLVLTQITGEEREGGGTHYCDANVTSHANVLELSDKWSWENTSAEVKAKGQD